VITTTQHKMSQSAEVLEQVCLEQSFELSKVLFVLRSKLHTAI